MNYFNISIVWVLLFTFHCIQFKEHPLDPTTLQGQLLQFVLKSSDILHNNNDYNDNLTFILMFPSYGAFKGNIKDAVTGASTTREAVDTICSSTLISDFPEYSYLNNIKGFISIDGTDQISSMPSNFSVPTNVPILGPDPNNPNRLVANDWYDLWNIDDYTYSYYIKNTLSLAIGLTDLWWSGSDQSGIASQTYTCSGWTTEVSNSLGILGEPTFMDYAWINDSTDSCNNSKYILCIAW